MAMKLSTGKVPFDIEFDNGEKDTIFFNPNDPDLATRLMKARESISARIQSAKIADVEFNNAGEPIDITSVSDFTMLPEKKIKEYTKKAEAVAKAFEETKKIIFEEIDTAFDGNVSSVVFKYCSPFAVVNGEYFIMQFLNAIAPEIQKKINTSNAELEKKMAKHLRKYKK